MFLVTCLIKKFEQKSENYRNISNWIGHYFPIFAAADSFVVGQAERIIISKVVSKCSRKTLLIVYRVWFKKVKRFSRYGGRVNFTHPGYKAVPRTG